jgi:hypothetical protein
MDAASKKLRKFRWLSLVLALALLTPSACIPDQKAQEERRQEIKSLKNETEALKKEITALKEQVTRLEAGQQEILNLLKKPPAPPAVAAPPPSPEPFTVSQVIREKDRLLGSRITVRGMAGPVVVHRKTLILKAPEGTVDVYFGDLPDVKTVNRLTSTSLDHPLTITGVLTLPPRGGANLRLIAEVVEF